MRLWQGRRGQWTKWLKPLRAIFDALESSDVMSRHAWLFERTNFAFWQRVRGRSRTEHEAAQRAGAEAILSATARKDRQFEQTVDLLPALVITVIGSMLLN